MSFDVRSILALVILLLSWQACPAGDKAGRTDRHGDPLPAGAIARLGTSRLQHGGEVQALAYSPDGKWLASAGADAVIRLWDAETGKAGLGLEGHKGGVRSVAFVPAGEGKPAKVLVSAGFDKTIRFWDLKTGKELPHIINHPGVAAVLTVSPDGKILASGGYDTSQIFLWKVEDGKEVRRWTAHEGGAVALAFGPDGKTLVSGGQAKGKDDYGLAVWETDSGKLWQTFAGHLTSVWAVAVSADGKTLASAGMDKVQGRTVVLWDPATGKQLRAVGGKLAVIDPRCLALTADGKTLAVGDFGDIKVFDTDTGAEQRGVGSRGTDQVRALAFSPDGQALASAGEKGRVVLWDVARRTAKLGDQGHTQPLTSVAVAPDGKTIATTSYDGTAWLWDRATGKPLQQINHHKVPGGIVIWCAAFSPDSRTVALAHQRDGITMWDVQTGQLQRHLPDKNYDRIVCVTFSPDGKWLASESIDQPHASLWDTATGQLVRTFPRGTKRFEDRGTSVAISPDNRFLASTARNGLNVWRLDNGELAFLKAGTEDTAVAFSPGGFLVATTGRGVRVIDAGNGTEAAAFDGVRSPFSGTTIAFSPDGRLLAVADARKIRLWEVAARRELPAFAGHLGEILSVAFTPEGKALVSASEDGTALVWDLQGVLPPLKVGDPKVLWKDLHDGDRLRAYTAFCQLRAAPEVALTLLKANLKPAAPAPAERMAELIKQLDSEVFKVRDHAAQELKKLGLAAEKALRQAAKNKPSLETSQRIDKLLAELDSGAEWQQTLTALKLLEDLPAAGARELLEGLAKGDPDSRLTRETSAILQRRVKRGDGSNP
jgi:WD40 repeat protein